MTKPFTVEIDASDFAIGAILSQSDNDGILHPVALYSRKFIPPEINYPVYDKELSAIISAVGRSEKANGKAKIGVRADK